MSAGKLGVQELRDLVASGRVDTVLVAITDMQGRLQGKRCGARYFLELSEAETAALAGVAQGTVKSRLSRARRRLADALGRREEWLDD